MAGERKPKRVLEGRGLMQVAAQGIVHETVYAAESRSEEDTTHATPHTRVWKRTPTGWKASGVPLTIKDGHPSNIFTPASIPALSSQGRRLNRFHRQGLRGLGRQRRA